MPRRLSVLLLALAFAGCSSVEPSPGMETGALSGSIGVLHVERAEIAAEADGHTTLQAAFARYEGIDGDSVLRLLGSHDAAPLGTCAIVDPAAALPSPELGTDEADVELVDVGALHVGLLRTGVADTEARLTPRTFPDLASVLAGVFYAGDANLPAPSAGEEVDGEVDEYRFRADGSADVGAFEVIVPAPAAPGGVALLGADGTYAHLDGRLAEIAPSDQLTLLWDGEDPRDFVEIELSTAGQTLACLARDEGSFRIPAADMAMLLEDAAARLTVRRVRLSPFDAAGMDVAFARVTAARSFPLSVR